MNGDDVWGGCAIVGLGETDYVRGSDRHVCDLILDAAIEAIADAGLTPADIDGIIPPPGFMSTEEIAAHLGIPDVAYHVSVLMGGASPTAALQTAAMAITAGVAHTVLICMGWNGYSALRPKPDARPTKRTMNLGPMGETVRNLYAPYGLMSAAQHYSLYLRYYVERYDVPEDAAATVAITCREHAQLNRKALMRGRPLSRAEYDASPYVAMVVVLIPGIGVNVNGASRWIDLPAGMRIQPSEFAKLAIIVFVADLLARRATHVREWRVSIGFRF